MFSYYTQKLLALLLLCCLGVGKSFAQGVGVNTDNSTADPSAILDIKSTDKGLLIPRVALTNTATASPVTSPATSLMVYNTATAGDVTPGFYFWNGTAWTRVQTGNVNWSLLGNTGTVEGTNFIGNTDNKALEFKVNNIRSGYVSNSSFGLNTFWGYNSGQNTTPSGGTNGNWNTGVGYNALSSNTTGHANTALGIGTLRYNVTGLHNVALGADALENNTSSQNVAVGSQALRNNTIGSANVANGYQALRSNTTGSFNTANGSSALFFNTTGSNNVANGYQSLFSNTTGSDNMANGTNALRSNTTGNGNTANGSSALFSNTIGGNNVANGYQALFSNTIGGNNVANGTYTLYDNSTGSNNVALGYFTLRNGATHSGVTAVGANINIATPRTNVTALGASIIDTNIPADNMVRIGNNGVTRTDLAGQLRVNAESIGTNDFTFPTTRGTTGQVLTTDGTGGTSWTTSSGGTSLPTQTGNAGKFLKTDGTNTSWVNAGANLELSKVTDATMPTIPAGSTSTIPPIVRFQANPAYPTSIAQTLTGGNTFTGDSLFTVGASGAGLYQVSVQLIAGGGGNVAIAPVIDVRPSGGATNTSMSTYSFYGVAISSPGFRTGQTNRGQISQYIYLGAGDTMRIRAQNTSTTLSPILLQEYCKLQVVRIY